MPEWVSQNGELTPADEARVSIFDSGFTQGIGLFETMRAYNRRIFRMDLHLERLRASAEKLGWTVVPQMDEMRDNLFRVMSASALSDARVRLTVTTGSLREQAEGPPRLTIVATAVPGGSYPEAYYRAGVTVTLCRFRQSRFDPTAGHKTTSYFSRIAALREAYAMKAFESLWFNDKNHLAEGSISSVFLVQGETLVTPPLETPVLPGITRAAIFELAVHHAIPVREQDLTVEDVLAADEIFLTNSMMEIMPVVRLDREPIGAERPGEVSIKLAQAYIDLVREECGDA